MEAVPHRRPTPTRTETAAERSATFWWISLLANRVSEASVKRTETSAGQPAAAASAPLARRLASDSVVMTLASPRPV